MTIGVGTVSKISLYNGRIHHAAMTNVVRAAYSASQVLCTVTVCFFDHHVIGEPPMRKRFPEVPLEDVVLPQLLSVDAVRVETIVLG